MLSCRLSIRSFIPSLFVSTHSRYCFAFSFAFTSALLCSSLLTRPFLPSHESTHAAMNCAVPTINDGVDSWGGTNCASGATNVADGTTCTITAASGYMCVNPGLCTAGTFAATGSCTGQRSIQLYPFPPSVPPSLPIPLRVLPCPNALLSPTN